MNLGTFHAYLTPKGALIPSTIRQKEGDALHALTKSGTQYRHGLGHGVCRPVRVTVTTADAEPAPLDFHVELRRIVEAVAKQTMVIAGDGETVPTPLALRAQALLARPQPDQPDQPAS